MPTTSYVASYTDGHTGTDRLGGLPSHLPPRWPQCQACQDDMAFVAQIYSSDRCQFGKYLCVHFYMCNCDCTEGGDLLLHMEPLPKTAVKNETNYGVEHPDQTYTTIQYTAFQDPPPFCDSGKEVTPEDWPHIFKDKVGGLFPYEGDGIDITEDNVCYLQMIWQLLGVQIFVCESKQRGIYLWTYS